MNSTMPLSHIESIPVAALRPNPQQGRETFDRIPELAASIERYGLLSPPLAREVEDGYELIAGERRLRAIQCLAWEQIPVLVVNAPDVEALEQSAVENFQRENLTPLEQARTIQLLAAAEKTGQEIAAIVGYSEAWVSHKLALMEFPEPHLLFLKEGLLTERHFRAVAKVRAIILPDQRARYIPVDYQKFRGPSAKAMKAQDWRVMLEGIQPVEDLPMANAVGDEEATLQRIATAYSEDMRRTPVRLEWHDTAFHYLALAFTRGWSAEELAVAVNALPSALKVQTRYFDARRKEAQEQRAPESATPKQPDVKDQRKDALARLPAREAKLIERDLPDDERDQALQVATVRPSRYSRREEHANKTQAGRAVRTLVNSEPEWRSTIYDAAASVDSDVRRMAAAVLRGEECPPHWVAQRITSMLGSTHDDVEAADESIYPSMAKLRPIFVQLEQLAAEIKAEHERYYGRLSKK